MDPLSMDLLMPAPAKINNQPCAACRMLRRRCSSNCLLAPYFPIEEASNFSGVHKVFGASNVTKMLQMVEERKREDAVRSIVYEASARLRDPIYGSAGAIFHLQKHIQDLELQLELTRARVLESQEHRDQLLRILNNVYHLHSISPIDDAMFDRGNFLLAGDTVGYDPAEFPLNSDWVS